MLPPALAMQFESPRHPRILIPLTVFPFSRAGKSQGGLERKFLFFLYRPCRSLSTGSQFCLLSSFSKRVNILQKFASISNIRLKFVRMYPIIGLECQDIVNYKPSLPRMASSSFSTFSSVRLGEGRPEPSKSSTEVWTRLKRKWYSDFCVVLKASSRKARCKLFTSLNICLLKFKTKLDANSLFLEGPPFHCATRIAEPTRHKDT